MPEMNWGAFDLNPLTVFDAIMRKRSVTRAELLAQPLRNALSELQLALQPARQWFRTMIAQVAGGL